MSLASFIAVVSYCYCFFLLLIYLFLLRGIIYMFKKNCMYVFLVLIFLALICTSCYYFSFVQFDLYRISSLSVALPII